MRQLTTASLLTLAAILAAASLPAGQGPPVAVVTEPTRAVRVAYETAYETTGDGFGLAPSSADDGGE